MGAGWFAADAANVKSGATVAVVGDGAPARCALGQADGRRADHRNEPSRDSAEARPRVWRDGIVTERGDAGVARILELTGGISADSVLERVDTQESMMQAICSTRPAGSVGYVGVPHGVELNGEKLFSAHVHIRGGPAPVRRYLPELINLVWNGKINPGKVLDLASRSSGGGIPRYGRAPGHKDAAATVIGSVLLVAMASGAYKETRR